MIKIIFLFLLSVNIFANIYNIEDISESLNLKKVFVEKLKKNNIVTTNDFLFINKTSKDRAYNAKKYKLKIKELNRIVSTFDLLRVKGIGPTVAKLFIAANIKSIREFQTSDIKKLEKKLIEVNKKLKLSPFTPNRENLEVWKNLALKLKIVIL